MINIFNNLSTIISVLKLVKQFIINDIISQLGLVLDSVTKYQIMIFTIPTLFTGIVFFASYHSHFEFFIKKCHFSLKKVKLQERFL